jgi:hypothetical protein
MSPVVGQVSKRLDVPAIDIVKEQAPIVQTAAVRLPETIASIMVDDTTPSPGKVPVLLASATQEPERLLPEPIVQAVEMAAPAPSVPMPSGEAEKNKSFTGKVQRFRAAWRLRYAAIDQEDAYGGVVVLEGGAGLNRLREGQQVRVSGHLTPPESRTGSAILRVMTLEMLD